MGVWRGRGRDVLRALGEGLDELHATTGTPVTTRRTWLQAWIDSYDDYEPVAVAVGDPARQRWDAVALLAVRRGRLLDQVVACGHGPSDAVTFPARDGAAAEQLAGVLAADLAARRGAWRVQLKHVVPHDLVVPRLARRLPSTRLVDGDVSPLLRAAPGGSLRDHVSKSHRKGVSRIRNRMVREDLDPQVTFVRDHDEVRTLLPELERLHRARDEQLGRLSRLDVPGHRDFFRRVVLGHAERDELELTLLRLDGRLAAYVICFLDDGVQRMWNTRFDPAWERLSPGKLAMEESVGHAVDEGWDYDFMRGEERYKASYANDAMVAQELYVSSGAVVDAGTRAFLALRQGVRDSREQGTRTAEVADALKQAAASASQWRRR